MDDSLETLKSKLITKCRIDPSVLREVVEGYVNKLQEDDFILWEEILSQPRKNTESPERKLEFSKSGIPLHMLSPIQVMELDEDQL